MRSIGRPPINRDDIPIEVDRLMRRMPVARVFQDTCFRTGQQHLRETMSTGRPVRSTRSQRPQRLADGASSDEDDAVLADRVVDERFASTASGDDFEPSLEVRQASQSAAVVATSSQPAQSSSQALLDALTSRQSAQLARAFSTLPRSLASSKTALQQLADQVQASRRACTAAYSA
jgi:hypothetical protein